MNKTTLIRNDVGLAPLTYYKIGGPARFYAQPESTTDLAEIAQFLKAQKVPYFVLGAGSNVLMDDRGFDGLVIHTSKLNRTLELAEFGDGGKAGVTVGASVTVAQLLRFAGANGLKGLEFLVGVPGNMGGVLCMNAGTKTGEIKNVARSVTVFNLKSGTEVTFQTSDLHYSYRANHYLRPHDLIVSGVLETERGTPAEIQKTTQEMLTARKMSQPIDKPSCGSVFKNPDPSKGVFAWKVIAEAGLRGASRGGAQISELHTNFIVNNGNAKAQDVLDLIDLVKHTVENRFAIRLEEEVKIVPYNGHCFLT